MALTSTYFVHLSLSRVKMRKMMSYDTQKKILLEKNYAILRLEEVSVICKGNHSHKPRCDIKISPFCRILSNVLSRIFLTMMVPSCRLSRSYLVTGALDRFSRAF